MEVNIKDQIMLIDDEDYSKIQGLNLYLYKRASSTMYAQCRYQGRCQRVHRIILNITDASMIVDHINGNGLDNRKENLRTCTQRLNTKNRSKTTGKLFTSLYKGVRKNRTIKERWSAWIRVDYKEIRLGSFKQEIEAAEAYNQAAVKYFGEFAKLNHII